MAGSGSQSRAREHVTANPQSHLRNEGTTGGLGYRSYGQDLVSIIATTHDFAGVRRPQQSQRTMTTEYPRCVGIQTKR